MEFSGHYRLSFARAWHRFAFYLLGFSLVCFTLAFSPAPEALANGRFTWPVAHHTVIRGFDPPAQKWLAGHRGVDLPAQIGTAVYASGAGTVVFAGILANKSVVSILHSQSGAQVGRVKNVRTTYEPVNPTVHVGQQVSKGQIIGYVVAGASHCGGIPRTCLHMGAKVNSQYINPLLLFEGHVVLTKST